jgi:hypothetical protein
VEEKLQLAVGGQRSAVGGRRLAEWEMKKSPAGVARLYALAFNLSVLKNIQIRRPL